MVGWVVHPPEVAFGVSSMAIGRQSKLRRCERLYLYANEMVGVWGTIRSTGGDPLRIVAVYNATHGCSSFVNWNLLVSPKSKLYLAGARAFQPSALRMNAAAFNSRWRFAVVER